MTELRQVSIAARLFSLIAIAVIVTIEDTDWLGWLSLLGIAVAATTLSRLRLLPDLAVAMGEGAAVASLSIILSDEQLTVLPYLATPILIAGLATGLRGIAPVVVVESLSLTLTALLTTPRWDPELVAGATVWLVTGIGVGLLGALTRRSTATTTDRTYRDALNLIRQLHALSGQLTSGLDPVDLADRALKTVAEHLVIRQACVVTRQGGTYAPLRFSSGSHALPVRALDPLLHQAWRDGTSAIGGQHVAIPIWMDGEAVALVLADCLSEPDRRTLDHLEEMLRDIAVPLNAALLFTAVRESATVEERQRLAREVHDGVAQDVASLGYLLDNLAPSGSTEQADQLRAIRREVTRVVTELRNSVFDLRNENDINQGLGQAIAVFARHIGSHSELTVHVTLEEEGGRLHPRVELELLRITQEAVNNARRHSGARNLWVRCRIQPPLAEIDVIDDGRGLQDPREDSHGLRIMRERAERIGADLHVESPVSVDGGTRIALRMS